MSGGFHPQHTSARQRSLSGVHWDDGYNSLSSQGSLPFSNNGECRCNHHSAQPSERRINSVGSGHQNHPRPHPGRPTSQDRSPRSHRYRQSQSLIASLLGLFFLLADPGLLKKSPFHAQSRGQPSLVLEELRGVFCIEELSRPHHPSAKVFAI